MVTNNTNKLIIYKELSYKINGLLFSVHNKLGRFLKEKQYADELEKQLKDKKIDYKREYKIPSVDSEINRNKIDFLIDNKIILEIKAKRLILKEDYYQLLRYLKVSGVKLGLMVNFRNTYLKPKRIAN